MNVPLREYHWCQRYSLISGQLIECLTQSYKGYEYDVWITHSDDQRSYLQRLHVSKSIMRSDVVSQAGKKYRIQRTSCIINIIEQGCAALRGKHTHTL